MCCMGRLPMFLVVFTGVQRTPSNSQVIHFLANRFLLIFSDMVVVHKFFEVFFHIVVPFVIGWKSLFKTLNRK